MEAILREISMAEARYKGQIDDIKRQMKERSADLAAAKVQLGRIVLDGGTDAAKKKAYAAVADLDSRVESLETQLQALVELESEFLAGLDDRLRDAFRTGEARMRDYVDRESALRAAAFSARETYLKTIRELGQIHREAADHCAKVRRVWRSLPDEGLKRSFIDPVKFADFRISDEELGSTLGNMPSWADLKQYR